MAYYGGWYLQPDCNMPAGNPLSGRWEAAGNIFWKIRGEAPSTAINFDPFGHSRGLVQLMAKAGVRFLSVLAGPAKELPASGG